MPFGIGGMGMSDARWRLRRLTGGLGTVGGYALSMALLAVASLSAIPAMIAADGERAWGAIALGQAVGAIAAAAIGYGWGVSGPARIAVASGAERRTEFAESVRVRLVLALPVAAVAAGAAVLLAPATPGLAALGAVAAAAAGISANWYFVGVRSPMGLLVLETLPRVAGTGAGILLMLTGAGAGAGLAGMLAGMLGAFVCSAVWVQVTTRAHRSAAARPARIRTVLARQRHGLGSALGSAVYIAMPLVIVSVIAPVAQPVFALVDKLQRQVSVALVPFITVIQGWVPRRDGAESASRAGRALVAGAVFAFVLAIGVLLAGPAVLAWLGSGTIDVGLAATVLMAAFVALNFFESLVAKAMLPSLDRLRIGAHATTISAVVALPLVAAGALLWGAVGALAAVVAGLLVRTIVEVVAAARTIRSRRAAGTAAHGATGTATDAATEIPEGIDA